MIRQKLPFLILYLVKGYFERIKFKQAFGLRTPKPAGAKARCCLPIGEIGVNEIQWRLVAMGYRSREDHGFTLEV